MRPIAPVFLMLALVAAARGVGAADGERVVVSDTGVLVRPAMSAASTGCPRLPFRIEPVAAARSAAVATVGDERPLPLAPPRRTAGHGRTAPVPPSPGRAVTTVLASLGVVLGLFLLLTWFLRRARPQAYGSLPGEVVETLGRAPLNGRQEMHLVRVGNKLLLLSVTATNAETLTEITEPEEIRRLTGICQQHTGGGMSASFREVLAQLSHR